MPRGDPNRGVAVGFLLRGRRAVRQRHRRVQQRRAPPQPRRVLGVARLVQRGDDGLDVRPILLPEALQLRRKRSSRSRANPRALRGSERRLVADLARADLKSDQPWRLPRPHVLVDRLHPDRRPAADRLPGPETAVCGC